MTKTPTKTLPKNVTDRALRAIANLHAWNAVVSQARKWEMIDGQPGRYEYDLMTSKANEAIILGMGRRSGEYDLDLMEEMAIGLGWSLEEFYRAIGQPDPPSLRKPPR